VTGALLLDRDDRSPVAFAAIRLIAGLFLSTLTFFLSLLVGLPWFAGPVAALAAALLVHRRTALALPPARLQVTWQGVAAAVVIAIVLAPIVIASLRMAPGPFPPVFYHVDTSYFLEKVHALIQAGRYPPESLGVAGGLQTYHYGAQGVTALLARASGLAAHHALFVVVLPLLVLGMAAAAIAAARRLAPALPAWVSAPLLLVPVPTLWYRFGADAGPAVADAIARMDPDPVAVLASAYQMWGVTLNPGHNIAAQFIVVASIAAIAAAPVLGWRLAVFLIGTAIVFKAPTGIALCAGAAVALACSAAYARRVRPLLPGVAVAAVFALVYVAFFAAPEATARASRLEVMPLYHLRLLEQRGELAGFGLDLLWLFVPAAVLLARPASRNEALPLLAFALTPLALVNALQLVDERPFGFGIDDNWLQVLTPVPIVVHAAWLVLAGGSPPGSAGRAARAAFFAFAGLTLFPAALVAIGYSGVLLADPADGHEYVDNRPLAAALSVIPVGGALIVTNDLRYPADSFRRDGRQMQIPALFGHRAFAVNLEYEGYPFSAERRAAQNLLRQPVWSDAIEDAARAHSWTHFVMRNDAPHPAAVPLERVFDNGTYGVYRFRR
jgi:hypothetical protein